MNRWKFYYLFFIVCLSICQVKNTLANDDKEKIVRLALPGYNWMLEIDKEGFKIEEGEMTPNGEARRIFVKNDNTGINMSIFLEKAPKSGDINDCREYYWNKMKKSPFEEIDIKRSQYRDMAILEYMINEYMGQKINQKNIHAYLVKDDIWIDVHLSKVNFKIEEENIFMEIIDAIKIKSYNPGCLENFIFGNAFYMNNNYEKAKLYYQKALDFYKEKPELERKMWIVLVDNLGVAYGIVGDLIRSKATYEYGIREEPNYPMFYYNLACTYAEMGDLENTISNLKEALKNKANMFKGEEMPDPTKDSCLKKYIGNPKFDEIIKEYCK